MTLTQTVDISHNRRVHLDIDIPDEVTAEQAVVIVKFVDRADVQMVIPPETAIIEISFIFSESEKHPCENTSCAS